MPIAAQFSQQDVEETLLRMVNAAERHGYHFTRWDEVAEAENGVPVRRPQSARARALVTAVYLLKPAYDEFVRAGMVQTIGHLRETHSEVRPPPSASIDREPIRDTEKKLRDGLSRLRSAHKALDGAATRIEGELSTMRPHVAQAVLAEEAARAERELAMLSKEPPWQRTSADRLLLAIAEVENVLGELERAGIEASQVSEAPTPLDESPAAGGAPPVLSLSEVFFDRPESVVGIAPKTIETEAEWKAAKGNVIELLDEHQFLNREIAELVYGFGGYQSDEVNAVQAMLHRRRHRGQNAPSKA
jgi:hypothetical protein